MLEEEAMMLTWMVFGVALGMVIGIVIDDYTIGLALGLGVSTLCCAGDLLLKAIRHKEPQRLSWFD